MQKEMCGRKLHITLNTPSPLSDMVVAASCFRVLLHSRAREDGQSWWEDGWSQMQDYLGRKPVAVAKDLTLRWRSPSPQDNGPKHKATTTTMLEWLSPSLVWIQFRICVKIWKLLFKRSSKDGSQSINLGWIRLQTIFLFFYFPHKKEVKSCIFCFLLYDCMQLCVGLSHKFPINIYSC